MANSRYSAIKAPNIVYWLGALVLLMHYYFLLSAFLEQSHLTDDSIQYLTLADNLMEHGVFSQSYTAPLAPDVQRTPGYPLFLVLMGRFIPLVLVVQHLLVLWTGYLLYRLLRRYMRERVARTGAWLYLLQPYPMIFASMVLSETLFIFLLVGALSFFLRWYARVRLLDLVLSLGLLGLAAYVRPLAYPLLLAGGLLAVLKLFFRRRWQMIPGLAVLLLLPSLLLGPWLVRNHNLTGRYQLTSMGDMGMVHGRLGGLEAWRQQLPVEEHYFYMAGDSIAAQKIGLPAIREYPSGVRTHETETYDPRLKGITLAYFLSHPLDGLRFTARNLGAMLTGVGYGWARGLTHSETGARISAGLQLGLNVLMYLGLLIALRWLRQWRPVHWIALVTVGLTLLISAAGWADGRYRVVIDPLLIIFVAYVLERRLLYLEYREERAGEV